MHPPTPDDSGRQQMVPADSLDLLRSANDSLRCFFARFAGVPVRGNTEEVQAMLDVERTLRAVGRLLHSDIKAMGDGELGKELGRYRDNLLRLRQELSSMQTSAHRMRAGLCAREEHLRAAQAWCEANRSTN